MSGALKEVRNRIKSVQSTQQITKAMKMVSAAKLKRAQDAITQMRPYANKLKEILDDASAGSAASDNAYARNTGGNKGLILAVSSNRGLAGASKGNINLRNFPLNASGLVNCDVTIIPIGKK